MGWKGEVKSCKELNIAYFSACAYNKHVDTDTRTHHTTNKKCPRVIIADSV